MVKPGRLAARLLFMAALWAGLACGILRRPGFQQPRAELRDVAVTGLGLEGGSLNLALDVYNPNAYELRTGRLHVAIDLEDTHFGDVVLEQPLRMAASKRTAIDVPLTFTWEGVGAGARALLSRGSVRYTFAGRMQVSTPIGVRDVALQRVGSVTLRNIMR